MSKIRKLLLGVVGFLVVCCGLSGLASLLPGSDDAAEPTTVALVEELQPTAQEAQPTAEDEEPRQMPEPTQTLALEPTDSPEPSPTNTQAPQPIATDALKVETSVIDPNGNMATGETAVVTQIVDGDTIDVEINGETYRVRYIGMDTPERGEPLFQEAAEANARLVANQTVILVKDVSETDRYGRLLRYVYLEDGTFVNGELVRRGFAQTSSYPPDVAFQDTFTSLQRTAVSAGKGLWVQVVSEVPTNTAVPIPTNTLTPILPTLTIAPQPTEPVVVQSTDTPAPPPPPVVEACACSGPDLDCGNFATHAAAQACYDHCVATVGYDYHRLDGNDNDGLACESLP